MGHAVRQTGKKNKSYLDTLRDRINAGKAVKVLNAMIEGSDDVTPQQERAVYFTINKILPSYQAIMMQVEHTISNNILDLQAQALEAGLDPSILLPVEKKASHEKVSSTPPTPANVDAD